MNPVDLHAAVHAAVTARLELARAATPGPWSRFGSEGPGHAYRRNTIVTRGNPEGYADITGIVAELGSTVVDDANAAHIAANDPAAAKRHCEADLETLAEHRPGIRPYVGSDFNMDRWWCELCDSESPCDELTRRAKAYAVEVTDGP